MMGYSEGAVAAGSIGVSVLLVLPAQFAYNSAGLVVTYTRTGAAPVTITTATQTPTGAWTSGGFCAIDATNAPELHRLDVPDAAWVRGVDHVTLGVAAPGFVPRYVRCNLRDMIGMYDYAVTAGTPTQTSFPTNLPNNAYTLARRMLEFTSGVCAGQIVAIITQSGAGVLEVAPPLTVAPDVGDLFNVR